MIIKGKGPEYAPVAQYFTARWSITSRLPSNLRDMVPIGEEKIDDSFTSITFPGMKGDIAIPLQGRYNVNDTEVEIFDLTLMFRRDVLEKYLMANKELLSLLPDGVKELQGTLPKKVNMEKYCYLDKESSLAIILYERIKDMKPNILN